MIFNHGMKRLYYKIIKHYRRFELRVLTKEEDTNPLIGVVVFLERRERIRIEPDDGEGLLKRVVRAALEKVYGVRGGIKPPLGGPKAGLLYPLRHRWWQAMSAIYKWTGLPDKWGAWRKSAGQ